MSRQDANAAFARTSFLYGGNAAYIEDLYGRYEKDPAAVDAEWRDFFQGLKDEAADVAKSFARRFLAETELAAAPERRTGGRARRPMGGDRKARRRQDFRQGASQRRRAFLRRRDAGHARFHPRADDDPRLSHARPFPRQARSARPRTRARRSGARAALLRLYRSRHGPPHLPRQGARPRILLDARNPRHPAPHLLPDARRRIHAHLQSGAEGLDPGAHRGPRQRDHLHARRQARHPQQARRGGGLREIHRRQIHRHQAFRARRRRVADPGARTDHQARRQSRRKGNLPRHAASRPPQCA